MLRFILQRLILIPVVVIVVNFLGFSFTLFARQAQQAANPFHYQAQASLPVFETYREYALGVLQGNFGSMPVGINAPVSEGVVKAALNSLGLLGIAFTISLILGMVIATGAVRVDPARISRWVAPVSTVGLALPGFYIGALGVTAVVLYLLDKPLGTPAPVPVGGFGWDAHLILPILALMIRPTLQVGQMGASLLSVELSKQYVTTARAIGRTWEQIRWRDAFRNVLAPVILSLASSLRLMVGELILVERLFNWPGLGRLFTYTIVPPQIVTTGGAFTDSSIFFLDPPLLASSLTAFAIFLIMVDTIASILVRFLDPRLGKAEVQHD